MADQDTEVPQEETQEYVVRQGAKSIVVNGETKKAGDTVELTAGQARAFSDRLEPTSGTAADDAAARAEQAEKDAGMMAPQATSSVPQDKGGQTPIPHMTPVNPGNKIALTPSIATLPPAASGRADNLMHDAEALAKAEEEGTGPESDTPNDGE